MSFDAIMERRDLSAKDPVKQLLSKFVARNIVNLKHPFSRGRYTYATNGHILVRVDRIETIEENLEAPPPEGLFHAADERGPYEWVSVPNVVVTTVECEDCEGSGKIQFGAKGRIDTCEDCDGLGTVPRIEGVRFAMASGVIVKLGNIYLKLIADNLPNAEIGLIESAGRDEYHPFKTRAYQLDPVKIRFHGGVGLLMPRI